MIEMKENKEFKDRKVINGGNMKQGWEIKKLGEVATYVNGYAFKPEHWGETGVPIIRIQNLNNLNADFNYCESDIPQKFVIEDGDILISWSASLGVYEWNRGKAYLNQHIFKVVFDKINISKYFLKYAVSAKLNEMLKDAHGATMKHIVKSDFDNTTIPYPPLPEQEKIVAELDCLSGIIEKKKQQLKELDALAESIFYTMFGDPITNEKGWEVKTIKEVAPQQEYKGDVPCKNGKYWLLNLDMVAPNTGEIIEQCLFEYEDIGNSTIKFNSDNVLYSKLRPYLNKVVVPNDIGYATSELVPLCPKRGVLNRVFFASILRSSHFVKYISSKVAGAKMPRVAMGEFREFCVILPPLPLQQEFADKIEAIEKQKELIKKSIEKTEILFNSRMDYYFN